MPSPLHKVPSGLLGLLNLKTLGRNPLRFGEEVIPTADVLDLYAGVDLSTGSTSSTSGTLPRSAIRGIPAGVIWRVRAVSARLNVGATPNGTWYTLRVDVNAPTTTHGTATIASVNIVPSATMPIGEQLFLSQWLSKPLILGPGAQLTAVATGDATGADHTTTIGYVIESVPV